MRDPWIDVLFPVIAPRETPFWLAVAEQLRDRGLRCAFLTLYEPARHAIAEASMTVFSPHPLSLADDPPDADRLESLRAKYGLDTLRRVVTHEKLTFSRHDEDRLFRKVDAYDRYFTELFARHRIRMVVHELGGFISQLTLFYNAKAAGVRHVFLEPAPFKGRLFYNVDSLDPVIVPGPVDEAHHEAVRAYVAAYRDDKTVVVPQKDRHHFVANGLVKLLQKRNFARLAEKLWNKYARNEREEFDAIANHVRRSVTMTWRQPALRRHSCEPDLDLPYVYFPFHVPLDLQLTVRETEYLDQIALVETLAESVPAGWWVYVKEHPAMAGGQSVARLARLFRTCRNVRLIHHRVNSYELIRRARVVVTINSKVGVEALMQGKTVLVLGRPIYAQAPGAVRVTSLGTFARQLQAWVASGAQAVPESDAIEYFARVYATCRQGELYDTDPGNIRATVEAVDALVADASGRTSDLSQTIRSESTVGDVDSQTVWA